jgi:tetratricopeptide (TPR) repeat protein
MSKGKEKSIDYLFEDPEIPTQKYALVSIVGPHMSQKCDVWGLKVRGTAESIDKAKMLCKRLLRIDNNYDIYTVEVGKFFPLNVEPMQVPDIEYQNDQLNTLIKSYLENRENANEHWHQRKSELIETAIKEGKNQEEFANKPEHPISVLHRMHNYEKAIEETEKSLEKLRDDLQLAKTKFENYTQEEKDIALKEFKTALENSQEIKADETVKPLTIEEIRQELEEEMKTITVTDNENSSSSDVKDILFNITSLEIELQELESFKASLSQISAPTVYNRTVKSIESITEKINVLKSKLNNKDIVNNYINENYPNPQYNFD